MMYTKIVDVLGDDDVRVSDARKIALGAGLYPCGTYPVGRRRGMDNDQRPHDWTHMIRTIEQCCQAFCKANPKQGLPIVF
jgi:hypothetical protein